jgi:hypothetical protein
MLFLAIIICVLSCVVNAQITIYSNGTLASGWTVTDDIGGTSFDLAV